MTGTDEGIEKIRQRYEDQRAPRPARPARTAPAPGPDCPALKYLGRMSQVTTLSPGGQVREAGRIAEETGVFAALLAAVEDRERNDAESIAAYARECFGDPGTRPDDHDPRRSLIVNRYGRYSDAYRALRSLAGCLDRVTPPGNLFDYQTAARVLVKMDEAFAVADVRAATVQEAVTATQNDSARHWLAEQAGAIPM